ncbi:MAG: sigma-70 family RNA polymerase sigma factor [Gemmatimonadaceae bacterium]
MTATPLAPLAASPDRRAADAGSDLWSAARAGDEQARDTLIRENLSLVHHVAQQLARTLATDTDFDELVSAGSMGLMKSVAEFDPSLNFAFSTFAVPKIRGAILDELRRLDHVPRSVRRKMRDLSAARETLGAALGRLPTGDELTAHLGIDRPTLWKMQADAESAVQVPLDRPAGDRHGGAAGGTSALDLIAGDEEQTVEDILDAQQQKELLAKALLDLDEQARTVLALYYYEDLKLHEIGEVLGLTESRVSQIRAAAIAALRRNLADCRDAF